MEALILLSTPQPHLPNLPRHHHTLICRATLQPNTFTAAAISKPAEILSSPLLSSIESLVSPPLPPPFKVSPDSLQYPPSYFGNVPDRSYSDDNDGVTSPMSYLTNILTSESFECKLFSVGVHTPLELKEIQENGIFGLHDGMLLCSITVRKSEFVTTAFFFH